MRRTRLNIIRRNKTQHQQQQQERETNPSRFFKIILPSVLEHNMLRIPDKFAKKFPIHVSTVATLTIPTGVVWKVSMSRHEGRLYFNQGWAKFMEHNFIRYGYFLEFEYLGNRQFSVHIFDLSCCEIDYSRTSDTHDCPIEDDDQDKDQRSPPKKPVQVKPEAEEGSIAFTVLARNCHIGGNYLHIPKGFEKKHMRHDLSKYVILQTKDGREWKVGYHIFRTGCRMRGLMWKEFVKENKWKVGEIYTFSLVGEKSNCLVLQVIKH